MYIHVCATGLLTGLCVDLAKAVVAHLVHEAVEEDGWTFAVDSELPGGGVVVVLFDVSASVGASSNTNHPQKLIDICDSARVAIKQMQQTQTTVVDSSTPGKTKRWTLAIGRVARQSTKDDEDVTDIQLSHNLIGPLLCGRHGLQGESTAQSALEALNCPHCSTA